MYTVRIEHPVADFARWKQVFDGDRAHRGRSGVRRYRVYRAVDDPRFVTVDLDFDGSAQAEAFVATMRGLWSKVEGSLIDGPKARILEAVEERDL